MDIDQMRRRIAALEREVQTTTSPRGLPFPNLYDESDDFLKAPNSLEGALTQACRVEEMDIDQMRRRIAALEREVQTTTSPRGLTFPNLYDESDDFLKAPNSLEGALTQAWRVEQVQGSFIENNWKQTQGTKAEIALSEMHLNSECHQDWDENCHQDWDENCHQNWNKNCHQYWDEDCHQDWDENCYQKGDENYHQDWDENCHQDCDEHCHQDWEDDCQHDWNEDCRHDWDSGLHCEEIG
ncbi:hypothetical protein GPALN_013311 [Globodera pallida]|nr:hypothetical protein GPALN_013311 [Globodera pallida]